MATLATNKIQIANGIHLVFFIHLTSANEAIDLVYPFPFQFHPMQLMLLFFLLLFSIRGKDVQIGMKIINVKTAQTLDSYIAIILLLNSIHLKYTYVPFYHSLPKLKSIHLIHSQWHLDILDIRNTNTHNFLLLGARNFKFLTTRRRQGYAF